MGSENRWTWCRRVRRRGFLLARGEEEGSIESKGDISGVKNTLKPMELHWVVAILQGLLVGVAEVIEVLHGGSHQGKHRINNFAAI